MIRQDKVHAIRCTGANLEEDVFNLVAHDHYERIPALSRPDRRRTRRRCSSGSLNRVTDTCIPEEEAMRHIERVDRSSCGEAADRGGTSGSSPTSSSIRLLDEGLLEEHYQIDPRGLLAAGGGRGGPAALRARLGGLDHSATSSPPA